MLNKLMCRLVLFVHWRKTQTDTQDAFFYFSFLLLQHILSLSVCLALSHLSHLYFVLSLSLPSTQIPSLQRALSLRHCLSLSLTPRTRKARSISSNVNQRSSDSKILKEPSCSNAPKSTEHFLLFWATMLTVQFLFHCFYLLYPCSNTADVTGGEYVQELLTSEVGLEIKSTTAIFVFLCLHMFGSVFTLYGYKN